MTGAVARWSRRRSMAAGFSYVLVMALVAALAVGLAAAGMVWRTQVAREREKELLFAGQQISDALTRYAIESPAGSPLYPEKLEDLLLDRRYPVVRRHLRRLYRDPLATDGRWGLLRQGGRIVGVYSLARGQPVIGAGFPRGREDFARARSYGDWRFLAEGIRAVALDKKAAVVAGPAVNPSPAPTVLDSGAPGDPPPRPPCQDAYDSTVDACWSDNATVEQNRACENRAQGAYSRCMDSQESGG